MKKINRVKENKDFTLTIKSGQFLVNNTFKVYWLKNALGYSRIGIGASTKLGNAVVRSTTRRRIRAICDSLIDYNNSSLDIIIIPKNLFLTNQYLDNYNALKELINKIL